MARSTSSPMAVSDTSANGVSPHSVAFNLLLSTRPSQWTKNLLVFAGVLFGRRLLDVRAVGDAMAAFGIFCALSGAVYLFNDIADRDADRRHPLKRRRPIASGAVSVAAAAVTPGLLAAVALGLAFRLSPSFGAVAAVYLMLQAAYSQALKN